MTQDTKLPTPGHLLRGMFLAPTSANEATHWARNHIEQLERALTATRKAWKHEADQGDGIMEEHDGVWREGEKALRDTRMFELWAMNALSPAPQTLREGESV